MVKRLTVGSCGAVLVLGLLAAGCTPDPGPDTDRHARSLGDLADAITEPDSDGEHPGASAAAGFRGGGEGVPDGSAGD